MTKTHELLARVDEALRPLDPSDLGILAAHEPEGVIPHGVGVVPLVAVDAVPGDADLGAAGYVRAVGERDARGGDDHLHDAALDEAVEAQGLAQRRVDVPHPPQHRLRPALFRLLLLLLLIRPGLADHLLVHRRQRRRALGRRRQVEHRVRQRYHRRLDRCEGEHREPRRDHARVELDRVHDWSSHRVVDGPLDEIVLGNLSVRGKAF